MFVVPLCMDGLAGNFWETFILRQTQTPSTSGENVWYTFLRVQLNIIFLLGAPAALVLYPVTADVHRAPSWARPKLTSSASASDMVLSVPHSVPRQSLKERKPFPSGHSFTSSI